VKRVLFPVVLQVREMVPFQAAAQFRAVLDEDLQGHGIPPEFNAPHPDRLTKKAGHHVDVVNHTEVQSPEELSQLPVCLAAPLAK
jgi:hypothetical protein